MSQKSWYLGLILILSMLQSDDGCESDILSLRSIPPSELEFFLTIEILSNNRNTLQNGTFNVPVDDGWPPYAAITRVGAIKAKVFKHFD